MATVYSSEVSVGTYNRIRIKCDYSGTSATLTIQFRRTSSYTGSWADSTATLTFNGTTKSAAYSYSGTVDTSWVDLESSISGYTVSTSGGTYSWTFNNPGSSSVLGCSGTITVPSQGSAPSSISISVTGMTYNSVTGTSTVGDWGGSSSTFYRVVKVGQIAYVAGMPCYSVTESNNSSTSAVSFTVNNSSDQEFDPDFALQGRGTYYLGLYAKNDYGETRYQFPDSITLPPAPLDTVDSPTFTLNSDGTYKASITLYRQSDTKDYASKTVYIWRGVQTGSSATTPNTYTGKSYTTQSLVELTDTISSLDPATTYTVSYSTAGSSSSINSYETATKKTVTFTTPVPVVTPTFSIAWNDTRDTATVTAGYTGAYQELKFYWGYSGTTATNLLTTITSGSTATGTIQYPNHGSNQSIYLKVVVKITSTFTYTPDVKKVGDVPNPILGVTVASNGTKKYIVDIVERKADGTVTSRWKNGQRIVKIS